jgi:hypothetical protein
MSTYDYVINRRHSRTVDQTLSQFNEMNQTQRTESTGLLRFIPQKVNFTIKIYLI